MAVFGGVCGRCEQSLPGLGTRFNQYPPINRWATLNSPCRDWESVKQMLDVSKTTARARASPSPCAPSEDEKLRYRSTLPSEVRISTRLSSHLYPRCPTAMTITRSRLSGES